MFGFLLRRKLSVNIAAGKFRLGIVGESRRQNALAAICGGRRPDGVNYVTDAVVVPEDDNPVDPNAVRVEIHRQHVGYLAREDAFLYRDRIRLGSLPPGPLRCKAKIRGGWDRGNGDTGYFGVWLDADFRPPKERYPCPYCTNTLEPRPAQNKKCPHCQGHVVVRNSQPLTADSAAAYDAILRAKQAEILRAIDSTNHAA